MLYEVITFLYLNTARRGIVLDLETSADRARLEALVERSDIVFGARAWLIMDAFARRGKDYLSKEE